MATVHECTSVCGKFVMPVMGVLEACLLADDLAVLLLLLRRRPRNG